MEFIRRNSDYALRSLAYMAKFPKGRNLTAKAIAAEGDVPVVFLRKTFQKLSKAKIIDSRRGPRGGFYLLKSLADISLKEILEAVQGRVALSDCLFEDDLCSRSKRCRVRKGLFGAQKKLANLLDEYTLNDFCEKGIKP